MVRFILAITLVVASAVACAGIEPNLLGGRQKCWPQTETRLASLMKGWIELDTKPPVMHTPEGEDFSLSFPFLAIKSTSDGPVLTDGGITVAGNGELVTVFGGVDSNASIAVCAIEEHHDGQSIGVFPPTT
jgi:hypothetical protein